jgi:hypothetical protein
MTILLLRSSIIGRVAPSLLSSRGGGGWNNGIASSSSFFTPTPTGRLLTAAATKFPSSIGNYFHNDEERIIERQQRQPTSGNLLSSWKSRMSIMPPRVIGTVLYNYACIISSRLLPSAIIAKFTGDGTAIMNTIDILISSSEQQQQQVRDVDDQWIEKNEDNSTTTTTTDTNAIQTTTMMMMMMMMEGGTQGQLLDLSIWLISTLKRRKKMMNKHKLRKRRKRLRLKTRK